MKYYDDKLRSLQEKTARYRHLRAIMPELYSQRQQLEAEVQELENVKNFEQADVDRLEGRSLAAFFYNVIGKMDEKLDAERREAYAARVKYDAAARELYAVQSEISSNEAEIESLAGCEKEYEAAVREKAEALKDAGGAAADKILELQSRIASLQSRKKELGEALAAGDAAYAHAGQVLSSLDSAEGWGTFDLLGGGLISDIAKHSHLDEAQSQVEYLQTQLRRFKTELADVTVNADLRVNIDGFLGFADFFFDGLFADWAVMDKISQSKMRVMDTAQQIENLLRHLEHRMGQTEDELGRSEKELDELIVKS